MSILKENRKEENGPNSKTVDFGSLWDVLRSTDEAIL